MTMEDYRGYQKPKDPHIGDESIIEAMRELHRIELESWLAALQEEHPNRPLSYSASNHPSPAF